MVDPGVVLVHVGGKGLDPKIIQRLRELVVRRTIRLWEEREDVLGYPVNPARRNHVARKKLPHKSRAIGIRRGRCRIVDQDGRPSRIAQIRKIAVTPGSNRYGSDRVSHRPPPGPFVVEKEKCPILAAVHLGHGYRTARGPSELVEPEGRHRCGERVSGVEGVIPQILVQASVQVIGPALGDGVDQTSIGQAVLGRSEIRQDLEFLNGLHQRRHRHIAIADRRVDRSIHEKRRVAADRAVDPDIRHLVALAAAEPHIDPALHVTDAGIHQRQAQNIAAVQRKFGDSLVLDDFAKPAALGLHQRGLSDDFDLLLRDADLQCEIQPRPVSDLEDDPGSEHRPESVGRARDLIFAYWQ